MVEGIANDDIDMEVQPRRFPIFAQQSASFTLWWRDGAKPGVANEPIHDKGPDVDQALRVFVQLQNFQDHITLTFYIDEAKLFTGKQILKREEVEANRLGERRTGLLNHLDTIRSSSYDRVVSGAIDLPSSDRPVDTEVATTLKAAADYVFQDIWDEFQSAVGFRTRTQDEPDPKDGSSFLGHGVIFVNQRGVMMSVRGFKTADDEERMKLVNDLKARNDIKVEDEQLREKPWRQIGRSLRQAEPAKCGVRDGSSTSPLRWSGWGRATPATSPSRSLRRPIAVRDPVALAPIGRDPRS